MEHPYEVEVDHVMVALHGAVVVVVVVDVADIAVQELLEWARLQQEARMTLQTLALHLLHPP